MSLIKRAVGDNCVNYKDDVAIIQSSLNALLMLIPKTKKLVVDGRIGSKTINAIKEFQSNMVNDFSRPSGKVEPSSATLKAINVHLKMNRPNQNTQLPPISSSPPLTHEDYEQAARILGCEIEAVIAVSQVETKKKPFLPSGRPPILFEAQWFSRFTGHIYDTEYPSISSYLANRDLYIGDEKEYRRLLKAMVLDRKAALMSASWGRFQVMGFNYKNIGYSDVENFIRDMYKSERKHLDAFIGYVKYKNLAKDLRDHNWESFAYGYNGPKHEDNNYKNLLREAYEKIKGD